MANLKHYAKDLRHLVLLNGFRLQEYEVNWPQVSQHINQSIGLAAQVVQRQSQVNHHNVVPNQQQSHSLAPTSQQQQIKNLAANQFPNQTLQLRTGSDVNQVLHVVNPALLNDQRTPAIQPQNDQVCNISPQQLQIGKIIQSAGMSTFCCRLQVLTARNDELLERINELLIWLRGFESGCELKFTSDSFELGLVHFVWGDMFFVS